MRWREGGSGAGVVLFVHGFPFSGAVWDDQLAAVPEGWRFLAPDLPGFGETPPVGGTLTMDRIADELAGFLAERQVRRAVVCGLSMGGYASLALWRRHPARVRALVLADTRAAADTPQARAGRYESAARARSSGVRMVAEAMLPRLLSARTRATRPDVVERLVGIMEAASVEGVAGALEGMAERPDSVPVLPTIDVPTLVLVGEADELTPPAESELLAARIPNAVLRLIPGAAHVTCMEAPESFNADLQAFLGGLP